LAAFLFRQGIDDTDTDIYGVNKNWLKSSYSMPGSSGEHAQGKREWILKRTP